MIHGLLSSDLAWRLGWILLHSLWQILLIGIVTGLLLALLSRRSASLHYFVSCCGMAAMYVPLLLTLAFMPPRPEVNVAADSAKSISTPAESDEAPISSSTKPSRSEAPADLPIASASTSTSVAQDASERADSQAPRDVPRAPWRLSQIVSPSLPWVVGAWLIGAGLLSLWNLGGWIVAQRLRKLATVPAAERVKERLSRLARQMHVSPPVQLLESLLVDVPMVIGWLRPAILLPASLATSLTPTELDALLAHELAHIRRHDYLVNLLQTLTETLLFYHPAVWLLSWSIRIQREHCCDDAAIAACGSKIQYARALSAIECRRAAPGLAMSVFGRRKNMTLHRIRRILGVSPTGRRTWFAGSGALSLLVVLLLGLAVFLTESDSRLAAQASQKQARTGAVPKASSPATAEAEKPAKTSWGETVNGLRTRISAKKKTFAAGHPIAMTLEITNVGDEVLHHAQHDRMINRGLMVTDERGRKVPYVAGFSQLRSRMVKIEPGQTQVLESFNLADGFYLRRPGRYKVVFPGAPGSSRLTPIAGTGYEAANARLPSSNKFSFEVTPAAAAVADGDPVGRLLPLVHDTWWLLGPADGTGKVRPGANRRVVQGWQIALHDIPTGSKRDSVLVWIWLTDEPAGEVEKAADWPPVSEYLGRISRWHVYVHVPAEALKRWPKLKEDIKRALNTETKPRRDENGNGTPKRPAARPSDGSKVTQTGKWSEAVNGLQGRLLIAKGRTVDGIWWPDVYLELRNVSDGANPLEVYWKAYNDLKCSLVDEKGKPPVPPPILRKMVMVMRAPDGLWLALPMGSTLKLRVSLPSHAAHKDSKARIRVPGGPWAIARDKHGPHFLSGTFTPEPPDKPRRGAWKGTLKFPSVQVRVPRDVAAQTASQRRTQQAEVSPATEIASDDDDRRRLHNRSKAQIVSVVKKEKEKAVPASTEKSWRIRLTSSSKAVVFNADGTRQSKTQPVVDRSNLFESQLSPDRHEIAYVDYADGDAEIFIADANGKNSKKLTDNDAGDNAPSWSSDGKRIAFASRRTGVWQIYVIGRDGKNLTKLTDEANGAMRPKFGRDGRVAYIVPQGGRKLKLFDLFVAGDKEAQAIVSGVYIGNFAWSPDGRTIAYSTVGKIVFHPLKTGKKKVVVFADIDKRLRSHTTHRLFWRPDSRAMACSITFLGDRRDALGGPAPIFGDDELFTISIDGKVTWFKPGKEYIRHGFDLDLDWLRGEEQ
jgi:beta-lactamase regulating signal transducer with metallopeptidase domain